jgi:hypothetical protein
MVQNLRESDITFSGAGVIEENVVVAVQRKKYFRKYDKSYLEFGFPWFGNESEPNLSLIGCIPMCYQYNLLS